MLSSLGIQSVAKVFAPPPPQQKALQSRLHIPFHLELTARCFTARSTPMAQRRSSFNVCHRCHLVWNHSCRRFMHPLVRSHFPPLTTRGIRSRLWGKMIPCRKSYDFRAKKGGKRDVAIWDAVFPKPIREFGPTDGEAHAVVRCPCLSLFADRSAREK